MLLVIAVVAISPQTGSAQRSETVTITEPGIYELADLFKQADIVALVKVVSGDTESYDVAIYKAVVLRNFKGSAVSETVYFGPYLGERLGWEYLLFLKNVANPIAPKRPSSSGYGTVRYARVFNEGYSSIESSYECVFDGKDVAQSCDYSVKVCTDYIKLPKGTRVFRPAGITLPFGCRWVRKTAFMSLLDAFAKR